MNRNFSLKLSAAIAAGMLMLGAASAKSETFLDEYPVEKQALACLGAFSVAEHMTIEAPNSKWIAARHDAEISWKAIARIVVKGDQPRLAAVAYAWDEARKENGLQTIMNIVNACVKAAPKSNGA